MSLPLLARATEDGVTYVLTPRTGVSPPPTAETRTPRMPVRAPGPGEQYRFHVDMGSCIGCKCCVVACNEQNGNPAAINWRRVSEIEGGWYPRAQRSYMSISCHHCLEPTCLQGCPVDAYKKDSATGIVLHSADACIGCQYCTWNCSYGVPQYNPERGVVGKCDMCHSRIELGQSPACVSACPTGAIQIEIVDIKSWRETTTGAAAQTGRPSGDQSMSTTRMTLPRDLAPNTKPVDAVHVQPGEPHWPLVVMMVLTQLSVGTFAAIWILQLTGASTRLGVAALTSLVVAAIALGASTLHLGRPLYAYRALKMWRRSWLSREVLLFAGFSLVASTYAVALSMRSPVSAVVGPLTAALGFGGVTASGCIYRVPSRPAWNTPLTLVQFNLTALTLGPLFAAAIGLGARRAPAIVAAAMAGAHIVVLATKYFNLSGGDTNEGKASAKLLATTFRHHLLVRGVLLALGAIALPLFTAQPIVLWFAFALALSSEIIGRYLFFVSAVPKHLATPYLGSEAA